MARTQPGTLVPRMGDNDDDRSFEEQMQDLNVPVERKPAGQITDILWLNKRSHGKSRGHIRITTTVIAITPAGMDILGNATKLAFGTAKMGGKPVLLIKVNSEVGYRLSQKKSGAAENRNQKLITTLSEAGIKHGSYEIRHRIKDVQGGWIAVPVEEGTR